MKYKNCRECKNFQINHIHPELDFCLKLYKFCTTIKKLQLCKELEKC